MLLDPNQLLGVASSVGGYEIDTSKYTTSVIKGLTYALVLNPIALAACVVTLITGLLAHCGDWSLVCINGFFSGIASAVTFVAMAVNFALFVIAQKRINSIDGAQATLGIALWLALAAWICVVFSSCAFCCGCGGRKDRSRRKKQRDEFDDDHNWKPPAAPASSSYGEQMRMDALQAERERKNRNKNLPKFAVYETEHVEELPLKHDYEDGMPQGNGRHANYPVAYGNQAPYEGSSGATYIDGVGPGARRVEPSATAYYDTDSGVAGYGAHNMASPTGTDPNYGMYGGSASATPMGMPTADPSQDYFYGQSQVPSRAATADPYAYEADNMHQAYAYPGDHDGGAHAGSAMGYAYCPPGHEQAYDGEMYPAQHLPAENADHGVASSSPYDAVQQATAAGRARRLPTVPSQQGDQSAYSPTSSTGRQPTMRGFSGSVPAHGGTDGFGLEALHAGAAHAAMTGHDGVQHQQSGSVPSDAPPGYDSAAGHDQYADVYGGTTSADRGAYNQYHYPREK